MKSKRKTKVISILLALVMCISMFSSSAFAVEEIPTVDSTSLNVQSIEEAGISREEAIEILGLTPEEAKSITFYALRSSDQLTLNSGDVHTFDKFTFTDYNIGSYFTVNANKLVYSVIWELPSGQPPATLDVDLYPFGESRAYHIHLTSSMYTEDNSVMSSRSEWIDTYYGVDYHFIYTADAWEWDLRPVTSSVTMIVGVV